MFKIIHVALNERAVVLQDGLPRQALAPGRHVVWGFGLEVLRYDVSDLVLKAPAEVRAVLPIDWYREIVIARHERGILSKDGVPRVYLRPGIQRYWALDPSIDLALLSVDDVMPELSEELVAVIPSHEYVDVMVQAHQKGLLYLQGRLEGVLEPGRYVLWQHTGRRVQVVAVDMRRTELTLAGQELMTRDKVTLRLSLAVDYAVADASKATHAVQSVRDAVYLMVQLAARAYVSGVTLDELLESRDGMTRYLEEETVPKAEAIGVRIERVGVKDIVLPGDMKALLNRVIEAEKEAAANVILRREETAATRSLANTARVMADNPVLLRLKEMESLKEIAAQIDEVRLVVGSEGLDKLAIAGLLGGGKVNGS
jgi:regulator of protease activity HflC (stomatin/prohibitin superfamily)